MAAATGSVDLLTLVIYAVAMVAIFYFLWYRPQQTQRRKMRELLDSLKPGDEVLTAGGMIGRLVSVEGDVVTVEVASGVKARFTRRAIIGKAAEGAAAEDR